MKAVGARHVNAAVIKREVIGRETEILEKLGIRWRDGTPHIRCPYLSHLDRHASWRWDVERRVAFCTCIDKAHSIFDVIMRFEGGDFPAACLHAAEMLGRTDLIDGSRGPLKPKYGDEETPRGLSLAAYAEAKGLPEDFLRSLGLADTVYAHAPAVFVPYQSTAGSEITARYRIRLTGDRFRWRKGAHPSLYGLDRLQEAKDISYVVVVEGESDTQTCWFHGFPALGLPGAKTWNEDRDAPQLGDIPTIYVVIEPDTGGAAVMGWLRKSSIASRVRLVHLNGAKDVNQLHLADPVGFRALFQRALDDATPYRPSPGDEPDGKQGRPIRFPPREPWPGPVAGGDLFNELTAGIRRHVVLGDAELDAVALWVLAVHAFDAFSIFPRLLITSPQKRCGKSTLLDVIERTVPRPLIAANITAAALFRVIEAERPTLLLDEADTFVRNSEEMRGVLNAGHKRNGSIIRLVEKSKTYEPRQFSAWAPVVLAAIGRLPGTVEDRSIIIQLKRRRSDEPAEVLRLDRPSDLERLARMAARWALDHVKAIKDVDPEMSGIINRAADNWRPLLAVASVIGGEWSARAQKAAASLIGDDGDEQDLSVRLLAEIRGVFEGREGERIFSGDLVTCLTSIEDGPWGECNKGRSITKAWVARRLKGFGISSGTIRVNEKTAKGYLRRAFDDVFARYLPSENVTASQAQDLCGSRPNPKASQAESCDVSDCHGNASVVAGCDGMTDRVAAAGQNDLAAASAPVGDRPGLRRRIVL